MNDNFSSIVGVGGVQANRNSIKRSKFYAKYRFNNSPRVGISR